MEGARLLGLVPEGVDYLEDLERQVGMAADPQLEHGIHGRFGGGPQEKRDVKQVGPRVCHPVDLGIEALDVLGFFGELGLGNK